VCPIGADEVVEGYLDLGNSASYTDIVGDGSFTRNSALKPSLVGAEVGTSQLVVEEELDIRSLLQLIEEGIIEGSSVDSIDSLVVIVSYNLQGKSQYQLPSR
jgi:hypothetical protein